jgi:hypothetical protein
MAKILEPLFRDIASYGGCKIGNPQLKGAFSEAMCLFMRESNRAKAYVTKQEKKHG